MINKKCKNCNKDFNSWPSRNRVFCSKRCSNQMKDGTYKIGHNKTPHGWKNPNWNGGIAKHSDGYIYIYSPYHPYKDSRGYVLEHRLIMEQYIKRFLKPEEVVHHINRKRNDNRIENLQLFENQSEHILLGHKKISL